MLYNMTKSEMFVSTHSRLKAAGTQKSDQIGRHGVSTHSRLKAAGLSYHSNVYQYGFNTQPPEGGWFCS